MKRQQTLYERRDYARRTLNLAGMVIHAGRQGAAVGEYRVNFYNGTEATAYYTDDLDDALTTGLAMARAGGVA